MSNQLLLHIVLSVVLHLGLGTVNFALHKSAVQSTTYYSNFVWTADKAVDGNTDGSHPEISRTCSATNPGSSVNHTWEVDIGLQIIVKTITVYGRTDVFDQLDGVKLYIGNVSRPWIFNQELQSHSSNTTLYVFKPSNAIASVISLMRSTYVLTICEVTVEGECLDGMFSEFCNKTCGKCFADQPCNKDNGTCPQGCDQGWKGRACKEGCERGNYGYNCNETCGNCLYGNSSCSTSDGNCSNGCIAGWQGYHCNRGCDAGQYGYNCKETCGNCFYGNDSCSTSDGRCTNGCKTGWQGDDCKIGTLGTVIPVDVDPNAGVIVGSVLAAVGVSIFAMVIIIVIVKNRRKRDNNETSNEIVTTAADYANLVVGNPDTACKFNIHSKTEKETTFSAIEESSLQRGMPIGTTDCHSGVNQPDVPVSNNYEKLRDVTESTESAYSTIDHSLIDDENMDTTENCSNYVVTLQSLESALTSVEKKISVLLDRKEKLLCKELQKARANKRRDKRKKNDYTKSDTDKDYTDVNEQRRNDLECCGNFVQMLQSLEGELRILEEKRKCLLERKEILLRQELAKTTENEK